MLEISFWKEKRYINKIKLEPIYNVLYNQLYNLLMFQKNQYEKHSLWSNQLNK